MITRHQVNQASRLVFGALPASEAVIRRHMGQPDIATMLRAMLASPEFAEGAAASGAGREKGAGAISRAQVVLAYRLLLGRLPENERTILEQRRHPHLGAWIEALLASDEYRGKMATGAIEAGNCEFFDPALVDQHRATRYLTPTDLRRSNQTPGRALLVGECLFDSWVDIMGGLGVSVEIDRVLFNQSSRLPDAPDQPFEDYAFQVVQVPLRAVLPEHAYLRLSYDDVEGHERLLEEAVQRLALFLDNALAWSERIPALVLNYLPPQQNPLGRLMPRYDLRNPIHMIERLNQALAAQLASRANCHLLDMDQAAAAFGRRFIQDDAVWLLNHGGTISDFDYDLDRDRLEPTGPLSEHYDFDVASFVELVWREAEAMWRTISGVDRVKMVCVDLDDTIWRGVAAERDGVDPLMVEGWPLGLVEALAFLKKRGVILAIISKNDEARVREIWGHLLGARFSLDDFAIRKIGWRPKAETIAEAIAEANVLPDSVVFIDDNPVERAAVEAALPGIRTFGAPHYYWKRILLWSAETQVPAISGESAQRNALIQAQVARETERSQLSRDDFLGSLGLSVALRCIDAIEDPDFPRAFELLNKTNQFNTTGVRWDQSNVRQYFAEGGVWWVFTAADRFTHYGLVGVVIVRERTIEQFVMSCRVVGLDVEMAVLGMLLPELGAGRGIELAALVRETPVNKLSRDLFARCGWTFANGMWRGSSAPQVLVHVRSPNVERAQINPSARAIPQ